MNGRPSLFDLTTGSKNWYRAETVGGKKETVKTKRKLFILRRGRMERSSRRRPRRKRRRDLFSQYGECN